MKFNVSNVAIIAVCFTMSLALRGNAAGDRPVDVEGIVAAAVEPLMRQYDIPGMAVAVAFNKRDYVYDFGVASKATGQPVTADTLFEIGSISKTFNAALATYAQAQGALSLSDMTSKYVPTLRGSAFDQISLVALGTYTPGGLPLQLPDGIENSAQLLAYFKDWKPAFAPGTMREYSNPSIGLLGYLTASRLHVDYATFLQDQMFPALALNHSYLRIPSAETINYAQGYEDDGTPIRLVEQPLTPETGGVRITAADLLRWLDINMAVKPIEPTWQHAIIATHTGYDQLEAGGMVQDLVWEQYNLPVTLAALQAGNSYKVLLEPNPVTSITPPLAPRTNVLLDKTGSTNGFGAYVAFIPAARIAVVLVANKDYPIPARVSAAYAILTGLDGAQFKH